MAKIEINPELIKKIDVKREGMFTSRKSFVEYAIELYLEELTK